jgi:cis-3-alkyl-4-acyloxetan-2-one decarboxylase
MHPCWSLGIYYVDMFDAYVDRFVHRTLRRQYRLRVAIDQGDGVDVVLLHGLGSSGLIWKRVAKRLEGQPYRLIAVDLLGFGDSPKPLWPLYSVDDHARSVIAAILRLRRQKRPVILVGHSMGCLVAVRVARLRPDLVKHLILYEMPLYAGLPSSKRYSLRRDFYLKLYNHIIQQPPSIPKTRLRRKIMSMTGLTFTQETLQPFVRSLHNTIVEQTTLQDMEQLNTTIDVIYGSLDVAVIRGKPRKVFARVVAPLQTHTIAQMHSVSPRASTFIAQRIKAVAEEEL